jgi:hypothetical protein
MAAVTQGRPQTGVPAERVFYLSMSIAIFAVIFVGFARSFFLRFLFPAWPAPSEPIFYVKGVIFSAWYVLLIVQASLVAADRRPLHRRLGVLGAAIAALIVVTGLYGSLVAAARPAGGAVGPMPLSFLIVPFVDMALFAVLVGCAIAKRNTPQTHKRLMLIASVSLVVAGFARWPGLSDLAFGWAFVATDVLLIPLIAWDLISRGRLHPATLVAGLTLIASQALRFTVADMPAWLAFCRWAVDLVRS